MNKDRIRKEIVKNERKKAIERARKRYLQETEEAQKSNN
jgi:hypothetical protein